MRIASITMVGQFPHGIDLHIRNLRWALSEDDHIFIITLPAHIKNLNLKNSPGVTFIPFDHKNKFHPAGPGAFIDFWGAFPKILKEQNINPEWFLFMEEDIWFYKKLTINLKNKQEIISCLPLQWVYHAIMVNDKIAYPRIWEGGTLVSSDIVNRAIDYGITFSFVKPFFYEKKRSEWEKKMGGPISIRYFGKADTFDEFSLYCALVEDPQPTTKQVESAVHLRGPESFHRKYPFLYETCTESDLVEPQKSLKWLCLYAAVALLFISGVWKGDLNWNKMGDNYKKEFKKILPTAKEWMKTDEYNKLIEVTTHIKS